MIINKTISLILLMFALSTNLVGQTRLGVYSAAFYNVENLFDTEDDPSNKGDNDFLPNGSYNWTNEKYQQKLNNIANVISQLAKDVTPTGPAIIGIGEIENRKVLEDLVKCQSIASVGYEIIHYDSPDRRGIDVACLYNPKLFNVTSTKTYPYHIDSNPTFTSRDQLLVSGIFAGEPFHVIVGHWPSRYGGDKSTIYREAAAAISKHIADSIYNDNPKAKVLIMGDFNDDPNNTSVKNILRAKRKASDVKENGYFNTTWPIYDKGIGTLCYNGEWNLFDQIIVSGNTIGKDYSTLKFWKTEVFNKDFLITQEGKRKGYPWRTFSGSTFIHGYSDHLPSIVYFIKRVK